MANSKSIMLHHYASSPFAEKIRRALAMKNLAWQSVDIPTIMPKPDLMALTGGYRRTPVLQIGSDIFCDTALILNEIEEAYSVPTLTLPGHEGLADMVANWTDKVWFPISVAVIFGSMVDHLPENFIKDREALSGRNFDADTMRQAVPAAKAQWLSHLQTVEKRLIGGKAAGTGAWLIGNKPGLIDLHVHMNIWFMHNTVTSITNEGFKTAPLTEDWFNRMCKLDGQGAEELSSKDAIDVAKNSAPRLKPANVSPDNPEGFEAGQMVKVSPSDFKPNWTVGKLVQLNDQKLIIERTDEVCGALHIHFPRIGYRVEAV